MSVANVVGELRPSQLLHTFGVGSVVDLPHLSVLVMGVEDWDRERCRRIAEDRLLAEVKRRLGPQVKALLAPPVAAEMAMRGPGAVVEEEGLGVPVAAFPRWMRCPVCQLLAPLRSRLFQLKRVPNRPDLTRYVHVNCNRAKMPPVLPARYLIACGRGHLDDFPWRWFVHKGPSSCRGDLRLFESGISGEAGDVSVRCDACGAFRRMSDAFGEKAEIPPCRGRRPHLRDFESKPCEEEEVRTILLGATNSWFPVSVTSLHVPADAADELGRMVEDRWDQLEAAQHPSVLGYLRSQGVLGELAKHSDEEIWAEIERRRVGVEEDPGESTDLCRPEWEVLSRPDPKRNGRDFDVEEVAVPDGFEDRIERVVRVTRLRAVQALLGFTRIRSPRDFDENTPAWMRAPLSREAPGFVPAGEVRGEGLFLQLPEERLASWCDAHRELEREFHASHAAWRKRCGIEPPEEGFPGIRYVLLHSFAHALMRGLALECGYAAASLTERIYASDGGGEEPMAGILVYTAASDSEGTLGGLVRLGETRVLGRQLKRALSRIRICSSDPLCADHRPDPEGPSIHGAACHACLFAPETSCERGNKLLDRSVLVSTVRGAVDPYFGSL